MDKKYDLSFVNWLKIINVVNCSSITGIKCASDGAITGLILGEESHMEGCCCNGFFLGFLAVKLCPEAGFDPLPSDPSEHNTKQQIQQLLCVQCGVGFNLEQWGQATQIQTQVSCIGIVLPDDLEIIQQLEYLITWWCFFISYREVNLIKGTLLTVSCVNDLIFLRKQIIGVSLQFREMNLEV